MAPKGVTDRPILIAGATASGKSETALLLAARLGGEILSADSRKVYRRLDAGTAKPKGLWQTLDGRPQYIVGGIPYHIVDYIDPRETFDAGRYVAMAQEAMGHIHRRGKVSIMAGGSGLYIRAFWEGLDGMPASDPDIREKFLQMARERGRPHIHQILSQVDPLAAQSIPPNNIQRTVRALEVYELSGRPISSFWTKSSEKSSEFRVRSSGKSLAKTELCSLHSGLSPIFVYIEWSSDLLRKRIRTRCRAIFPKMLEETGECLKLGYMGTEPGFQSLGYPEALGYLKGSLTVSEAMDRLERRTCAYAKRQRTWFRRQFKGRRISVEREGDGEAEALAKHIEKLWNGSFS